MNPIREVIRDFDVILACAWQSFEKPEVGIELRTFSPFGAKRPYSAQMIDLMKQDVKNQGSSTTTHKNELNLFQEISSGFKS